MTTKIVVPGVAGIPLSTVTTAGDLIAGSGAGAVTRLALGATDGMVLKRVSGALGWQLSDWALLASSIAGGNVASFDLTSIPATFSNLMLISKLTNDGAVTSTTGFLKFNGDGGPNYDFQSLQGNNVTSSATPTSAATAMRVSAETGSTATAGNVGYNVMIIPSYADIVANKGVLSFNIRQGTAGTASTYFAVSWMGIWHSIAAINQLTLTPGSGTNFVINSSVQLYGMR